MKRRIEKAVVLGAGTMVRASRRHFANAGLPCIFAGSRAAEFAGRCAVRGTQQDCCARDWSGEENPSLRPFLLQRWRNAWPSAIFEDDLARCGEADWIIEVVAENLEIKRKLLFARWRSIGSRRRLSPPTRRAARALDRRRQSEEFQKALGGKHIFSIRRAI